MAIEPTPGRIVWFYPNKSKCPGEWPGDDVPLSAQIAYVSPRSGRLNLSLSEKSGQVIGVQNIRLHQGGDKPEIDDDEIGVAMWMPYQRDQAAKHAAEDAVKTDSTEAQSTGAAPTQQPNPSVDTPLS